MPGILDIPQAVAMASERCRVELRGVNEADWSYATQRARTLGWEKNLRFTADLRRGEAGWIRRQSGPAKTSERPP